VGQELWLCGEHGHVAGGTMAMCREGRGEGHRAQGWPLTHTPYTAGWGERPQGAGQVGVSHMVALPSARTLLPMILQLLWRLLLFSEWRQTHTWRPQLSSRTRNRSRRALDNSTGAIWDQSPCPLPSFT
jgi:hypothetical protein